MSSFSALKTAIQSAIKQNGNNEITGDILQDILLSIVSTLGDSAINNLETGLQTESQTRGNNDAALSQAIENEATARGNQDTQLGNLITGIKNNIDNGYVYAGIATPSTIPVSGKVFYIATQSGTYTNLGNTAVKPGISILKYNGSAWSNEQVIYTDGGVFDVSAYNDGATYASLEALLSDANLSTIIPSAVRKGGMSIKFVQTDDNKYVQFRYMSSSTAVADFTNVANWQGVSFDGSDFVNPDTTKKAKIPTVGAVSGAYGEIKTNYEWAYVLFDNNKKLVFGIKDDGSIVWSKGVPDPVKEYVLDLLTHKVDKEENKSLLDNRYHTEVNNDEYLYVLLDNGGNLILKINTDNTLTSYGTFNIRNIVCETLFIGNSQVMPIPVKDFSLGDSIFKSEIDEYEAKHIDIPDYQNTAEAYVINIQSQEEFNGIESTINTAISRGYTNICVMLNCDVQYDEDHLNFISENYPNAENVDIIFNGCNHSVKPKGTVYRRDANNVSFVGNKYKLPCENDFSYDTQYLCGERELITEEKIKVTTEEIIDTGETVTQQGVTGDDAIRPIYKIKLNSEDYDTDATHIAISCRFQTERGIITSIVGGYAYFYIPYTGEYQMTPVGNNGDWGYAGLGARYALSNSSKCEVCIKNGYIYIDNSIDEVLECNSSSLCTIETFRSVEISNIRFVGNNYIPYKDLGDKQNSIYPILSDALICIKIDRTTNGYKYVRIHHCSFTNTKGNCIGIREGSGNVKIDNNVFKHIYRYGVFSCDGSKDNYWVYNYSKDSNVLRSNFAPIYFSGQDELIAYNEIVDFVTYGISGGNAHDLLMSNARSGIIEYNKVYNTKEKIDQTRLLGMCETGSIYTYHCAKELIIRNNIVFNTIGIYRNTGIVGDGYSPNLKIYHNIVLNTLGSFGKPEDNVNQYFAIYTSDNSKRPASSDYGKNNIAIENFVDTSCRINYNVSRNNIKGRNFLLMLGNSTAGSTIETNAATNYEKDVRIFGASFADGIVKVPFVYRNGLTNYMNDFIRNIFNFNNI